MNYQTKTLNKSLVKSWQLIPCPQKAWSIIIGFIFVTIFFLLTPLSSFLQILFPLGSFVVAAFLYKKYPVLYIGFTWWIWFLSPLIARIVEYQNGLINPSIRLIIATPYLVTILTGITFICYIPRNYKKDGLSFILAFVGVIYALFTGLIQQDSITIVIEGFLSWIPAIFWGFYLNIHWRSYPEFKKVIQSTFCWGILLMGIYGLIQYFNLPPWDQFWLNNSAEEIRGSVGWDEIRIWSTLNLPIGFTNALLTGLLLLLTDNKQKFRFPAAVIGLLCLLLARVRSSWFGFILGLIATITSLKSEVQIRLITTIFILILCISPLVFAKPFYERIIPRLQTLTNLQQDTSINARLNRYSEEQGDIVNNVIGSGLGSKQTDVGALAVLKTLGWLGIIPYLGGLFLAFMSSFRLTEASFDPFVNASRSISLSILTMTLGNNMMVRFYGVMLWGFLGITLAAHKYYRHHENTNILKNLQS